MDAKLQEIIDGIEKQGHKVVYITKFGSHLYGLSDSESDDDFRGVFIASKESLLLTEAPKTFNYSSGKEDSKNDAEDIDITFVSLQYWLSQIQKGEINALDMLYSFTNMDCVIYKDERMNMIFAMYNKLFDSSQTKSYMGYAIGQAKRYGIRGSRLGIIKNVKEALERTNVVNHHKLEGYIDYIIAQAGHEKYCFKKEIDGIDCIIVCDKCYQGTVKLKMFYERMQEKYNQYGKRAELASQNSGLDFKALSHAYRALIQIKEIILTGKVEFPLRENRDLAYSIKKGKEDWKYVENVLTELIEEVNALQESETPKNKHNKKVVDNLIMSFYE